MSARRNAWIAPTAVQRSLWERSATEFSIWQMCVLTSLRRTVVESTGLVGTVLEREVVRAHVHDEELDEQIGVSSGDLGAVQPPKVK
jgi:hypothetical protein